MICFVNNFRGHSNVKKQIKWTLNLSLKYLNVSLAIDIHLNNLLELRPPWLFLKVSLKYVFFCHFTPFGALFRGTSSHPGLSGVVTCTALNRVPSWVPSFVLWPIVAIIGTYVDPPQGHYVTMNFILIFTFKLTEVVNPQMAKCIFEKHFFIIELNSKNIIMYKVQISRR